MHKSIFFKIKMKDKLLQYQQKLCVEKKLLDKLLLKCHQKHYCVKKNNRQNLQN